MVLGCSDGAARPPRPCHLSPLSRGKQGRLLFVLQRAPGFVLRAKADGLQAPCSRGSWGRPGAASREGQGTSPGGLPGRPRCHGFRPQGPSVAEGRTRTGDQQHLGTLGAPPPDPDGSRSLPVRFPLLTPLLERGSARGAAPPRPGPARPERYSRSRRRRRPEDCDPSDYSLAHLGSSGVGEGHQEHHRGPGPR